MTISSADLIELGRELDSARNELEGLYDDLGADYNSDAALQFWTHLRNESTGEQIEFLVVNNRESVWQPVVGGRLPNSGQNWDIVVESWETSVQPQVVQAAELLEETRTTSQTLETMTSEDLEAFASIPTALGRGNEVFAEASTYLDESANGIQTMINDLNSSNWSGAGRDAYAATLPPYKTAFTECQTGVEDMIEANIALAQITQQVMDAFLALQQDQLNQAKEMGSLIFDLVQPMSWLGVAEDLFNKTVEIEEEHIEGIRSKMEELANSAETTNIIEKANRVGAMVWPTPQSGINSGWDR